MATQFNIVAAVESAFATKLKERLKGIADEISNELIEAAAKDAGELVKTHFQHNPATLTDRLVIEILNKK